MDIVAAILEIAHDGTIKTKIMYNASLSFTQLKEYLALMLGRGLLKYSKEEKKYTTTERGMHFLKMYREVGRIIAPKRSRLKTMQV